MKSFIGIICIIFLSVGIGLGLEEFDKQYGLFSFGKITDRDWEELSHIGRHNKYYNRFKDIILKSVKEGAYYTKINDDRVIVKIHETSFEYFTYKSGGRQRHYLDDYRKITYITSWSSVWTRWVHKDWIRPVHSNWGLTQDVWKLDERVANLERSDKPKINDNPFKTKKQKRRKK